MDFKPKKGPYNVLFNSPSYIIGVCPHRDRDYLALDPSFGSFTLLKPVSH
jgi:hypothetical protein